MSDITVKSLLEAGVHFGHQTHRWNPKVAKWLFGERAGVHIIDLEQTLGLLHQAQQAVTDITADGGKVLFVGTKRQGRETMRAVATHCQMPYVIERWLGGTLTNWPTISRRLELLSRLTEERASGDWDRLPKKEVAKKQHELSRLETLLGGLRGLSDVPAAVYVNDVAREDLAVKEARKLKLPIIGVVDSNADPVGITYPIPANDDAVRAITITAEAIADAVRQGTERYSKTMAKQSAIEEKAAAQAEKAAAKQAVKTAQAESEAPGV